MADLNYFSNCIQSVLSVYAERRSNQKDVEARLIFDVNRHHYQLFYIGWEGHKQIFYPIIHVDIQGDKIWLQLNQQEPHTYPLREVLRGMRAS